MALFKRSVSQNIGGRTKERFEWGRSAIVGALVFVTSLRFMSFLLSSAYHSSSVPKKDSYAKMKYTYLSSET